MSLAFTRKLHPSFRRTLLLFGFLIILLISFSSLHQANAQGFVFYVQINKSFTPLAITPGDTSRLNITVYNPNGFTVVDLSWTDTMPAEVQVADPMNITTSPGCGVGVTVTATAGSNIIELSNGEIPPQVGIVPGSCSVGIDVTSSIAGNHVNTIPAFEVTGRNEADTADITNNTPASATLNVSSIQPPVVTKSFTPNTIFVGETSRLQIQLSNVDLAASLTGVSFTDTLPTGLILADPVNSSLSPGCGVSASLTAVPDGNSVTLNSGQINASAICLIEVNVTSITPGQYENTIPAGAITNDQDVTNGSPASADLNVQQVGLSKEFDPNNFQAGDSTTLTITLTNPTAAPFTGASLTDNLPGPPLFYVPGTATTTCGTGTATIVDPQTLTLTGGTIPASSSCVITVQVSAPAGTATGNWTNIIPEEALITNEAVTNILGASDRVDVYAVGTGVTGSKSFLPSTILEGQNSRLTIQIFAPADTDLTNTTITDNLPEGVLISNAQPPQLSNCGAGVSLTAINGTSSIELIDGTIPAGTACQIQVWVTSDIAGVYTNQIDPEDITNDQDRTLPAPITAVLTVNSLSGMTVEKSFFPAQVAPNGISTLTLTLENTNSDPVLNLSVEDDITLMGLGTNSVFIANPANASTSCGGNLTAVAGTQLIQLANGTIPAQVGNVPGICTITVDVQAGPNTGNRRNFIYKEDVTGTVNDVPIEAQETDNAFLFVSDLKIEGVKGFDPLIVTGGATSTLSVQLLNERNATLYGIAFTDNMPEGMIIADPANFNTGTCGGTLTGTPGDNTFSFSGGTLGPNSTCTLSLSATMTVNDNLTNTIPIGAITTLNGVSNTEPTSATLTNLPGASISKAFDPNLILVGDYSILTITIQNTTSVLITGLGLLDILPGTLPNGLVVASGDGIPAPSTTCGDSATVIASPGEQNITLSNGSLPGNASCVIVVPVTSSEPGSYENIIPANTLTGIAGGSPITNNEEARATLDVLEPAALGNYVWIDSNLNGIQDEVGTGVDGVTVYLYEEGNPTPIASTTTSGGGFYLFDDLLPGNYFVEFELPAGYNFTSQNSGSDDAIDSDADTITGQTQVVSLTAGEYNDTLDAGLNQVTASLGDYVWWDQDEDGQQDPGEPGIDGVTVQLYEDGNPSPIASTVTSGGGIYGFTNLTPGSYYVEFVLPEGYNFTASNVGDDGQDSDADTTTGLTQVVTLAAGDNNLTLDAGMYYPGLIGVAKRVIGSPVKVEPGVWEVTFEIYVENYGLVELTSLQVTDDLDETFPPSTTYSVQDVSSSDFTVNWPAGFNGSTDTNLLTGTDTLGVEASGTITVKVNVTPAESGPFWNTAVGTGETPSGETVQDESQDGTNPDKNGNGDPTDDNDPTPVSFEPNLFDPPFGIKLVDSSNIPVLRWTMVWINDTNIVAINASVSDPIPAGTVYIDSGSSSGYPLPPGVPAGSTTAGVSCKDTSALTSTTYCYFEGPTPTYPRGRIVWEGTLGPDFGITEVDDAANRLTIAFNVSVNAGITSVRNRATVDSDRNGDLDTNDSGEQRVAYAQAQWNAGNILPETGFAPGKVTALESRHPATYTDASSLELEIPRLGIRIPILGIPQQDNTWDVSWLWDQAGWLEGTAFPTMNGNSVLTSHVYKANGLPGPFVSLSSLRWNDEIIIHAFGNEYVYKVQESQYVLPHQISALAPSEDPMLTLITCNSYNEITDSYQYRLIVQAVLIEVR